MKIYIRMIVVLALISVLSGLVLGGLYAVTREQAENNILKYKKIPAVADIYEVMAGELPPAEREAVEEGLLAEKRYVDLGDGEAKLFFVIRKEGAPYAVALEDYGQGFGGDLGVMVGFVLESRKLVGIGVTTMAETPGVGTRVRDPKFAEQFRGVALDASFKVKKDGGVIDAVSGATISSRAVADAIRKARDFYAAHREKIMDAITQVAGENA